MIKLEEIIVKMSFEISNYEQQVRELYVSTLKQSILEEITRILDTYDLENISKNM